MNHSEELSKFNALSETWWDPKGPLRTLHHINPARLTFTKKQVDLKNKRLIDVGCGAGLFSESLAQAGADVTAIDLAPDLIKVAKAHAEKSKLNIDYQCTSLEAMVEKYSQQFDIVVCMELLEHLESPADFLNHLVQLLRKDGVLLLSTLNRTLRSYLLGIVAAEYLLKLVPMGTHDYNAFIKPAELNAWLEPSGWACADMQGIAYNPLLKHAKLISELSVNYIAAYRMF